MTPIPCRCKAYPFPHRPLGGKCDGSALMEEAMEKGYCHDTNCQHYDEWTEHHPYGMGTAHERMVDCKVPKARECPYINRSRTA